MSRRIIFTNTPSINTSLSAKYVVGSGVGSRNRSVYRALQRRSSNNAQGMPCCIPVNPIQQKCPVEIDILNIATFDSIDDYGITTYILNGDQTINECQILTIPADTILRLNINQTLTNSGTINVNGTIDIANNGEEKGGIIMNSGTITIADGGNIYNYCDAGAEGGTITNSGTITIAAGGNIYNYNDGAGLKGGTITNTGTITIAAGGIIHNSNGGVNGSVGGYIYTYDGGITTNNGTILNYINLGALAVLGGYIYTYGGGITTNNGTIENECGTVSTSDGLSGTCGAAGTHPIGPNSPTGTGIVDNNCPPP